MILNSTSTLFFMTMMFGIILSLSSSSWLILWIGMEVTIMSFIPLINSKLMISSEASMKYFIIQSMSSSVFMLGVMFMLMGVNMNIEILIGCSMLISMGVAPFHNWVLSMIEGLNYYMLTNMFTTLKLVPLLVLMTLSLKLIYILIYTLAVGSILGLNQNSLRKILSYSSIFNMGFMIFMKDVFSLWLIFMILYSFNLFLLTYIFENNNFNYLNQLVLNNFDYKMSISIWVLLLSSGGIPPMMGFWGKMISIELALFLNEWLVALSMIFMSLLVMFYYNRLCFTSMSLSSLMMKWTFCIKSKLGLIILVTNLFTLPLAMMFKYV
uniref:NADH dehydrogenase subunit 2 n=1 Tax=Amritodus flavoscutatus TaxID=2479863 RepID=UPI002E785610|nr:NADH dehydrogenase subunit 2 [Amritodus flavoscutatus]WQF70187.1 NADH dehydrogenase subunit 2 [Amritodus flavoscutatus]